MVGDRQRTLEGIKMFFNQENKHEIQRRAWSEVRHRCRGIPAYSKLIGVPRSTASDWFNKDVEVPFEYLALTELLTGVSIERLSPFTEERNKKMRAWQTNSQLRPIEIPVDKIVIGNFPYFNCFKQDLRIIVDNEYVLISGLAKFKAHQSSGKAKALVIILDVEALLLEMRTLAHMNAHFLISEEIAITLRLKQLLGNRQGKHSDSGKTSKREKKNNPPNSALSLMLDEVKGRTDEHIARILGVGKDTYHSAEKACLQGIPELIDALDRQELSIAKAAKIAKLPTDQQLTFIQQEKKEREYGDSEEEGKRSRKTQIQEKAADEDAGSQNSDGKTGAV